MFIDTQWQMLRRTQAHIQRDAESEGGPEHLTCLLLIHLMDIVVDIIVNFSDFFLKFEVHVLVLAL